MPDSPFQLRANGGEFVSRLNAGSQATLLSVLMMTQIYNDIRLIIREELQRVREELQEEEEE